MSGWTSFRHLIHLAALAAAIVSGFLLAPASASASGPSNQTDTTAISVAVGSQFTGTNVGTSSLDNEVWWKFTVTAAEQGHEMSVSLCGSDFDTSLEIRTGAGSPPSTIVAGDADGGTHTCPANDQAGSVTFVPSA